MDPTPIVTNPQDETKQTINEISLPKDFDPTLIVTNPQKKKDEYLRTLAEIAISVKTGILSHGNHDKRQTSSG